jgi:hypothetical protein
MTKKADRNPPAETPDDQPVPKRRQRSQGVVYTGGKPVLHLDFRRRTSMARIGHKQDTCYLVEEFRDGSMLLIPATTVPIAEVEELRAVKARAEADEGEATTE